MSLLTWSKNYPPASEELLDEVELLKGHKLPYDYRKFLLKSNGGVPSFPLLKLKNAGETRIVEFFGVKNPHVGDLLANAKARFVEHPQGWLPIAIDSGGNFILLSLHGAKCGKVFWKDHEAAASTDGLIQVASSIDDLFESLRPETVRLMGDLEALAESGNGDDLQAFFDNGYQLNDVSRAGRTLAEEAARYGNLDLLQACIAAGAATKGALQLASMNGHINIVRYLVEDVKVDVNAVDSRGRRSLACAFRHPLIQNYLTVHGATK